MNRATARSRTRNLRQGLSALTGLALLGVGIPVALLRLSRALVDSGNPLHGVTAPWKWSGTEIKHTLTRALDNQTVISTISRVGLVLAWIALVVIVISVAAELRSLRVHGIHLPRQHGLGWSQTIARRLAVGLLALSTMIPSHIASAAPLTPRAVATLPIATAPAQQSSKPTLPIPARVVAWTTYRVTRGDSIYGIAGRLASGDRTTTREIAQEILDRNLGHTMNDGHTFTTPGVIQIGWVLDIPRNPNATAAQPQVADPSRPGGETYTVRSGDSYWEIADHRLEVVLGQTPTPREVLDETHNLIDANVERLGNRTPTSMIHAGDVLILPSSNGDHPPPAVVPPPVLPVVVAEPATPPTPSSLPLPTMPTPSSLATPPTPTTTPPTTPPVTPASTSTPSTVPVPVPTTPVTQSPPNFRAESEVVSETSARNPWTDLVIGSLFATGVAATVTKLRRRRLARRTPGHRLVHVPPVAAATETVLHAESTPDGISALHRLLGLLAGRTRLDGHRPLVRAVQLTDTGIELLWTQAQPTPTKPWTTTDGGWSWRTLWPTEQPDDQHARPMLPTLVPVGVRADGAELLLDLETAGSLSVDGDPELVTAFTHQLVLALGASPLADNIDLITVDLDVPGAEHFERIRTSTLGTATGWLTTRTAETGAALTKSKAQTTFAARLLGRSNDEWEPIVVVATSADEQAAIGLTGAALPGSGSVAIVSGMAASGERIVLHDSDRAEWVRLGLVFTPYLLTPDAGDSLAALLDNVEDAAETEVVLNDSPIQTGEATTPMATDEDPEPRCYDVLVRVLGEVNVEGVAEHLTDAEVELLALLATVRPDGPVNLDRLATLLAHDEWRTPKPRSIQARISHLRSKLGNGTDGNPLIPDSRASTGGPSRYLISARVVTDIDLLDHAYRVANDLPSSEAIVTLRQAFELVRGKPYTARSGYTWAYDEHAAARAEQVIGDVAARLIDLHGEAGDAAGIQWVIQRARRGLDGSIAEMPFRLVERVWAARMADPGLAESTAAYERELAAAADDADPTGDYEIRAAQVD